MNLNRKYTIWDSIRIPFKYSPFYAFVLAFEQISRAIIPTIQLYFMAMLVDKGILVAAGNAEMSIVIAPLCVLLGTRLYNTIIRRLAVFCEVLMCNKLRNTYSIDIIEKQSKLAYKHIENPETWDLISRVTKEPELKVMGAYYNVLMTVATIVHAVGIFAVLATQIWWAAIIIIIICIPIYKIAINAGKQTYEAERETSKFKRKADYLSETLSNRDAAFERSLFGFGKTLNNRWYDEYENSRRVEMAAVKKAAIRTNIGTVLTVVAMFIMILSMLPAVLSEQITPGMFTALCTSLSQVIWVVNWSLPSDLQGLANTKEYLNDLTKFHELEANEDNICLPNYPAVNFDSIEFKNVSFTYPGTTNKILDGATFTLKSGQHYAFVGTNGAGKTTITKLITGLYDNYEGDILLNGKPLRDYSVGEIKSLSAVVYQDFARYSISLKDNILIGDIKNIETPDGLKSLEHSCNLFDMDDLIKDLPYGIDTNLGKAREVSSDISGGQWQRVALARAMVSPAPLIILDEPTAALDPISESKIYSEFEQISKSRTTIFISHRLGSTKLADNIIVIGEGKVLENGTHDDLMGLDGVYAEMYISQKSWYE